MYEATVSVTKENEHLLEYVKEQMLPALNEVDGIVTAVEEKFYGFFSLACADTYRFQVQRRLLETVSQALTLGYKNIYVRNLLNIDKNSFYQNVLVNTICIFDNDYDRQAISRVLDTDKPICLDGYFNFRLDNVKRKWQEITKLVSDNFYVLSDSKMIIEFLQYLLESTPSKAKKMSVTVDKDNFVLYDSGDKVIEPMTSLAKRTSCEEEIMLNVLYFKPQQVRIYHSRPLKDELRCMMDELFDVDYAEVR